MTSRTSTALTPSASSAHSSAPTGPGSGPSDDTTKPPSLARAASTTSSSSSKRTRLTLACNQCRKRKVRCDTETPKCRNCWLRDEVCEAIDPRYPNSPPTVRRWATKDGLLPGQNPAATHRNQAWVPKHGPGPVLSTSTTATTAVGSSSVLALSDENEGRRDWDVERRHGIPTGTSSSALVAARTSTSSLQRETPSVSPAGSGGGDSSVAAGTAAMSWVSRGYQDSINAGGGGGGDSATGTNPDLVINTDNTSYRVKYMGGSSLQCLAIFVDIYLRRQGLQTISSNFRNGMSHVEEFRLQLNTPIPPLPDLVQLEAYLDTFFTRVWPVYPVTDRPSVEADIQYFHRLEYCSPGGLQANLTSAHIPRLISLFSIIVIAADEAANENTALGDPYLATAYSLFAHLVATPYLASVQAIVLLAVALRCRFKDGQSWHVLGQAIRIAKSIGLHRYIHPQSSSTSREGLPAGYQVDLQLHGRVWWACYALEKLMEIETGRPSAVNDEDIDQVEPPGSAYGMDGMDDKPDFFAYWVALARVVSQINKSIYRSKPNSTWELLSQIGRLDQKLLEWANNMPESIKPGNEVVASYGDGQQSHQQHISSFLSLQYYQAQITLLRASLIFPTESFTNQTRRLGPTLPSYVRLLQSENICIAAARATIRQVLELADHGIHSFILSATQPFLAAVVLALHIVKNPGKRLVRPDLELLITVTEYLESQFQRGGQTPSFVRGIETLRTSVSAAVKMAQQHLSNKQLPTSAATPQLNVDENTRDPMSLLLDQSQQVPGLVPDLAFFEMGDEFPLGELWGTFGSYSFIQPTLLDD